MQLADGATVAQVLPVSVTFPSSAVPTKLAAIFNAVALAELFVIVRFPIGPFVSSVRGEPVTLIEAVDSGFTATRIDVRPVLPP